MVELDYFDPVGYGVACPTTDLPLKSMYLFHAGLLSSSSCASSPSNDDQHRELVSLPVPGGGFPIQAMISVHEVSFFGCDVQGFVAVGVTRIRKRWVDHWVGLRVNANVRQKITCGKYQKTELLLLLGAEVHITVYVHEHFHTRALLV